MTPETGKTRSRLALLAMALLFVGPLAVAGWLYLGGIWSPAAGSNHGELLNPIVTLPRDAQPRVDGTVADGGYLLGKWNIVHFVDDGCDPACMEALLMTRQVRLAMARYADRIQRVMFINDETTVSSVEHPQLLQVRLSGNAGNTITTLLNNAGGTQRVFVVDPLGNLVLAYPLSGPPADIRDDLKKLLRLSRIG